MTNVRQDAAGNWNLTARGGIAALALAAFSVLGGCGPTEPETKGAPVAMRRLTEDQYRNIIADVFGSTIKVAGRFDPLVRTEGLLGVSVSKANITPSGFERYYELARLVSAQVVDEKNRTVLVPCKPTSQNAPDDACAKQFYGKIGRLLFRRPISDETLQNYVQVAHAATETLGSFYAGLASGLVGVLASPNFLYVSDFVEGDPANPSTLRLDAYSRASRLSFTLWNSAPDQQLLDAAEHGDLDTERGLARQADRMLASPRFKAGVRAFFDDMFGFEDFSTLAKDGAIYPAFSSTMASAAREQTLRTVVDHLVTQRGDYRDLFTTRKTFVSDPLGLIYHVSAGAPGDWVPYEFPEGDPHAGILTHISFVALHSHPGKTSSTLRGRAVREVFMCQKVPDPPSNVNFDLFNDPNSPNKTARQRLSSHSVNPACAGCHKIMDPIGLTLESFDGSGQLRTTEQDEPIDVSGELDGKVFKGAAELGRVLHDNPDTASCLVNRLFSYSVSRAPTTGERDLLKYLQEGFSSDGYRFPQLMRRIVTSKAFYAIAPAADANSATKSAAESLAGKDKKS